MNNSSTPEPERQSSYYDLLCQMVDPQQARHVTRILTELCHCEENSFPFLLGILHINQIQLNLKLSEAVARAVHPLLIEFQKTSQLLLEALNHQQIVENKRVARSLANSGWPLTRTYQGKVPRFLQSTIRWFEEKTAYRSRWLFLTYLTVTMLGLVGMRSYYCDQYTILQNTSVVQLANLEKQNEASIDQRANDLANEKLQNLQPRSYTFAQILEKNFHRVELKPGKFAWKLIVHLPLGIPQPDTTFDADLRTTSTIYLPDTDGALPLSETAPSGGQKPGKKP